MSLIPYHSINIMQWNACHTDSLLIS